MTCFQCYKIDQRYNPVLRTLVYEADSEHKAIEYLKENGGGIYKNILHNFEVLVEGKQLLEG